MTDKRFEEGEFGDFGYWIEDTVTGEKIENEKVVALLNQLADENEQLRQTIEEMKSDERLYANEIVKLNKEAKEVLKND